MRKYLTEFIGTFLLTFTVCALAYAKVSGDVQPIAIGAIWTAMIYAGGYISGAHYSPAISIALWLRGKLSIQDLPFYVIAQLLAAVLAAALVGVLMPFPILEFKTVNILPTILGETIGTFTLAWVILNVATSKTVEGNNYFGLAIGFAVIGCSYSLSGTFNPAVAVALCTARLAAWSGIVYMVIGSVIGAALAAVAYRYINSEE
jgi:aquaporin Z